jgi:hypothetical protein
MSLLTRLSALVTSITTDKETLVTNLTDHGLTASEEESLADLVAKVADIELEDEADLAAAIEEIETLINGKEEPEVTPD